MAEEKEKDLQQEEAATAEQMPQEEPTEPETEEAAEFDVEDFLQQYKALEASLQAAQDEKAEVENRMLRLQADFDNYRRRQRESNEDVVKQAAAGLAAAILPVLDNLDRALAAMQDTPDKEGVDMISQQLHQVLENAGLAEVEAEGAVFDPNFHQAVAQQEVEEDRKGKVLMVLQKGYTFNGKLLRAAMVQVGM